MGIVHIALTPPPSTKTIPLKSHIMLNNNLNAFVMMTFIMMVVIISAGQGDRSMGAFAKHDYTKKVIELIIRGALKYMLSIL